jgi:RNA polymerase sigma-70 factor (ECF subfamily)
MCNSGWVTPEGNSSGRNSDDLFCMTVTMAPIAAHVEDAMQLACEPVLALSSEVNPETLLEPIEGGGRQRSDEELVIAAQNGDRCALGELLGRHLNMLHCFARRYTANADDAHDLVQETMLRVIRNIGSFRGESRFVTWLCSIVVNKALSDKRREKHIRWICLDEQGEEEARFCLRSLQDVRRNPEEDYSHREIHHLLRHEALKLPPRDRFIWRACDLDDCSIKKVAGALGMNPGAAKSRLGRARVRLSAAMKKTGAVGTSIRTGHHGV